MRYQRLTFYLSACLFTLGATALGQTVLPYHVGSEQSPTPTKRFSSSTITGCNSLANNDWQFIADTMWRQSKENAGTARQVGHTSGSKPLNTPMVSANTISMAHVYLDYLAARDQHEKALFAIQEQQFRDQRYAGMLIQWLVFAMVITGIILSVLQFTKADRLRKGAVLQRPSGDEGTAAYNDDGRYEIALSLTNIEIKSSVIGLAILVVSFAFFFAYLKFVYLIVP